MREASPLEVIGIIRMRRINIVKEIEGEIEVILGKVIRKEREGNLQIKKFPVIEEDIRIKSIKINIKQEVDLEIDKEMRDIKTINKEILFIIIVNNALMIEEKET